MAGKAPQWRVFRIKVNNPEEDIRQEARFVQKIPENASWMNVNISSLLNADVTTIFQQQYLTPPPQFCFSPVGYRRLFTLDFPLLEDNPSNH